MKEAGEAEIAQENMKRCKLLQNRLKDVIIKVRNRMGSDLDDEDESAIDKLNKFKN